MGRGIVPLATRYPLFTKLLQVLVELRQVLVVLVLAVKLYNEKGSQHLGLNVWAAQLTDLSTHAGSEPFQETLQASCYIRCLMARENELILLFRSRSLKDDKMSVVSLLICIAHLGVNDFQD